VLYLLSRESKASTAAFVVRLGLPELDRVYVHTSRSPQPALLLALPLPQVTILSDLIQFSVFPIIVSQPVRGLNAHVTVRETSAAKADAPSSVERARKP